MAMRFKSFEENWAGKGGKAGKAQNHQIHTPREKGAGGKGGKDRGGGMADGADRPTWGL